MIPVNRHPHLATRGEWTNMLCSARPWPMTDFPLEGSFMFDPLRPTDVNLVPTVIEQTSRGERAFDIFSRLLK